MIYLYKKSVSLENAISVNDLIDDYAKFILNRATLLLPVWYKYTSVLWVYPLSCSITILWRRWRRLRSNLWIRRLSMR